MSYESFPNPAGVAGPRTRHSLLVTPGTGGRMSLSLGARFDRPLVARGAAEDRYCLLTVRADGNGGRRVPLNLALAIDTSGSMHGSKLARAKDAAGLVVRHLTAIDRVAI